MIEAALSDNGWAGLIIVLLLIPLGILFVLAIINIILYIRLLKGKKSIVYIIFNFLIAGATFIFALVGEHDAEVLLLAYSTYIFIFAILLLIDRKKGQAVKLEGEE